MWIFLELLLIALVAAPIAWAWRQAVKNAQADRRERRDEDRG
ncbi:hypothetical protein [Sphaerotilus microaerophilus]|nr:hypothetical protein [Sphaerotilus sp. FB-5]